MGLVKQNHETINLWEFDSLGKMASYTVSMKNNKWYLTTSAIVFTVIAVAHLARIIWVMEASLAGYPVPLWVSGVAVMISGYLATRGFMEAHKL